MVDDQDLERAFRRFEFEADFVQCLLEGGTLRVGERAVFGGGSVPGGGPGRG